MPVAQTAALPATESSPSSCDAPASPAPVNTEEIGRLAADLKALADPTRLGLLRLIASHPDATACICDLTGPLGVSQPTVSHHMKILAEAGLVTRRQHGRWVHYSVKVDALRCLGDRLAGLADPPEIATGNCC